MKCKAITAGAIGCVSPTTDKRTEVVEMKRHTRIALALHQEHGRAAQARPPQNLTKSTIKIRVLAIAAALLASVVGPAHAADGIPFGVSVLVIELTDNDIQLNAFVDGEWKQLKMLDPQAREIFGGRATAGLKSQGGLSEMFWASEPTHYLEDQPNFDGTIESFLSRFPEGVYEFEGRTVAGNKVEGEAVLSHVLPALPEILSPVSDTDDPPAVDPENLVIDWEPVTMNFDGDGPVEIDEYQVIVEQADPARVRPWTDGKTRAAVINLPPSVTSLVVPPEFLVPGARYDFEIVAIELNGNSTISVGEFVVPE